MLLVAVEELTALELPVVGVFEYHVDWVAAPLDGVPMLGDVWTLEPTGKTGAVDGM